MSRFVCEAVEPEHKTCRKCGEFKTLTEFNKSPQNRDGVLSYCKPCSKTVNAQWKRDNPTQDAKNRRNQVLKKQYGLTRRDFDIMWRDQGGRCRICQEPMTTGTGKSAVDHCHTTGKVRAILCSPCNIGLGLFRDDPERLQAAVSYLEVHQSPQELTVDTPAAGHA